MLKLVAKRPIEDRVEVASLWLHVLARVSLRVIKADTVSRRVVVVSHRGCWLEWWKGKRIQGCVRGGRHQNAVLAASGWKWRRRASFRVCAAISVTQVTCPGGLSCTFTSLLVCDKTSDEGPLLVTDQPRQVQPFTTAHIHLWSCLCWSLLT